MKQSIKYWHCVFSLLPLLSSCVHIDFNAIETDGVYRGSWQNKEVIVRFEHVSEGDIQGKLYWVGEDMVATPHYFVSEVNRRGNGKVLIDNKEAQIKRLQTDSGMLTLRLNATKLRLHPIRQPEFKSFEAFAPDRLVYDYACIEDVTYGHAEGYWTSYPETDESFGDIYLKKMGKLMGQSEQELRMDIYYPKDPDSITGRPLLLLIHGGAFYNGDKQSVPIVEWSKHFASLGCVVASMNYRMGFRPLKADVERAGYRAVQDAHAAMRYLVHNADLYHINKDFLFVGGTSAGAITALNLAFMRNENRPTSTMSVKDDAYGDEYQHDTGLGNTLHHLINEGKKLVAGGIEDMGWEQDLGMIETVAPELVDSFSIRGVVNMWGALDDVAMLRNSPNTAILSFHGDADRIVPYGYDYPFRNVLDLQQQNAILQSVSWLSAFFDDFQATLNGEGRPLNEMVFPKMYGSHAIHQNAGLYGVKSELHTVAGGGHSLHVNDDLSLSDYFYTLRDTISDFLYRQVVSHPVQLKALPQDIHAFGLVNGEEVETVYWKVEGGIVLDSEDHQIRVLFFDDVDEHIIRFSGKYKNGIGFNKLKTFD